MTTATKEQLAEFKRLKSIVQKDAAKTISDNLNQINVLLAEIKDLAEATGITVDVRGLASEVEDVASLHPDWSSSSYDC